MEEVSERFVALDVHKNYVVAAAVDGHQELVLKAQRIRMEDLGSWVMENLRSTDLVVFEATTNAWEIYDLLEPMVASVKVAHTLKVTMIARARVKTDAEEARQYLKGVDYPANKEEIVNTAESNDAPEGGQPRYGISAAFGATGWVCELQNEA